MNNIDNLQMNKDIAKIVIYKNNNKKEIENINKLQKEFLRRYNNYYSTSYMKNKILFYKNNISTETKKHNIKKEQITLHRLKKVIKIYNSDLSIYTKLDKISKIFENHKELWESYYDLIIPFLDTKFINDLNKIYIFLKSNSEELSFINYYSNIVKKNINYDYAKFIIELYLKENVSYNLEDFLYNIGINNKVFNYCIDTICEFDYDLYSKFIRIKNYNDLLEIEFKKNTIKDLVFALNTGKYPDNIEFSVVEFFKRIPFKYSRNFYNDLLKFIKTHMPEYEEIIYNFLKTNHFQKKDTTKEINVDELMDSCFSIGGKSISKEEKLMILTYMQENELPMFNIVFYDILLKHRHNKINLNVIKKIKKNKILIP